MAKEEADLERDLKKEIQVQQSLCSAGKKDQIGEKFELERELEEDKIIIALDLNTMTYDQQQYYEDCKNKIISRSLNIQLCLLLVLSSQSVHETLSSFVGHITV